MTPTLTAPLADMRPRDVHYEHLKRDAKPYTCRLCGAETTKLVVDGVEAPCAPCLLPLKTP